jgi:hypothetical protein
MAGAACRPGSNRTASDSGRCRLGIQCVAARAEPKSSCDAPAGLKGNQIWKTQVHCWVFRRPSSVGPFQPGRDAKCITGQNYQYDDHQQRRRTQKAAQCFTTADARGQGPWRRGPSGQERRTAIHCRHRRLGRRSGSTETAVAGPAEESRAELRGGSASVADLPQHDVAVARSRDDDAGSGTSRTACLPEPNTVYITPPNRNLTLVAGHFRLVEPAQANRCPSLR